MTLIVSLRILMMSWLVLLSCFAPCLAQQSAGQPLFLIWDERGKYGFIDGSGRVHIKPQFDGALPFTEGLAAVSTGKEWGFIDSSGKIVVPLRYHAVSPFSDSLAAVTIASRETSHPCGYIGHAGKFVIRPQSKFTCQDFNDGFAPVSIYDKQVGEDLDGYVDKEGDAVGGRLRADPFSEGWALVIGVDGTSEFVSSQRKSPIEFNRDWVPGGGEEYYSPSESFSEGLALVCGKSSSWDHCQRYGFVNTQGKIVFMLPPLMRVVGNFKNGRALILQEKTERVRVELGNGEVITMNVQVSVYGYIDGTGKVVIPARFSNASDFSEGLAAVSTGKPQPANQRDVSGSAAESSFSGEGGGNWLCINPAGDVVIKECGEPLSREEIIEKFPKFGESFGKGFVNGLFFNKTYVGGNQTEGDRKAVYGYMDKNGKYVWTAPHGKNVVPPRWWRENYPSKN